MSHLPSGFGVPQWPLSFDQLGSPWMVISIAAVVLLGALLLLARRHVDAGGDSRRPIRRRRPWRISGERPPQPRLRRIV
jgi:hypothetical protein